MRRSFARRIDDALWAFATGHSRRDLLRVRRRRFALVARGIARRYRKQAERCGDGGYWACDRLAKPFVDLEERMSKGRERVTEALLSHRLQLYRIQLRICRRAESPDVETVENGTNFLGGKLEATSVAPVKLDGHFHEGLLEEPGFYLRKHHQFFGAGNIAAAFSHFARSALRRPFIGRMAATYQGFGIAQAQVGAWRRLRLAPWEPEQGARR